MEKLKLKHTILYAKGWYIRSENIWNDLKNVFVADGYVCCSTQKDIFEIVLYNLDNIPYSSTSVLTDIIEGISPDTCFKSSYFTTDYYFSKREEKEKLPTYDFKTAILYYFLSKLRFLNSEFHEELPTLDKKVLPVDNKKLKSWNEKYK